MLCLYKKSLSNTITVDDKDFMIHTDFRFWLAFLKKVENNELSILDILSMFPNEKPTNYEGAILSLLNFAKNDNPLPRSTGHGKNIKVYDYDLDADLIFSAFLEVYHIDLLDEKTKLHFHKFNALLKGLHGTKLNEIMSIRSFDENDKSTYEQTHKILREAWEIREEIKLTEYEQELLNKFENSLS